MHRVKAFAFLIRFPNLFIIALTQLLVGEFIIGVNVLDLKFLAIVISTVMVAASGNIINDYFDVRFDHINKPKEIWVGTVFSRRGLLLLHGLISFLAVVTGAYSSLYIGLINVICIALLWFYSQKLKCVPVVGNILVALLTGMVVFVLALKYNNFSIEILIYVSFSFLINIIREITKDIQDVKGDFYFNCKTIPTKYGILLAKKVTITLQIVFTTSLCLLLYLSSYYFKLYIGLVLLPLSLLLLFKMWKAHKKKHFKNVSRIEKIIILFGVLSLILFKL